MYSISETQSIRASSVVVGLLCIHKPAGSFSCHTPKRTWLKNSYTWFISQITESLKTRTKTNQKTQQHFSTTSTFRPCLALRRATIQSTFKENVYEHITWLNSGRNQGLGLTHPLHGFLYFFTRGVWLQIWWNKTSCYVIQSKTNNEKIV